MIRVLNSFITQFLFLLSRSEGVGKEYIPLIKEGIDKTS